jgi:hypothetical protein
MVDGEVIRLRQLRERALRTRALATAMNAGELSHNTALARSAHSCWRIAKLVTGVLRGHPNLNYQRDYSPFRAGYDRLNARFMAMIARCRDTSAQVFCESLWDVARELDDARALTWSAELGDTLGRAQLQLRQLLREFEAATLHEAHAHRTTLAPLKSRTASRNASRTLPRTESRARPAMDRDELNTRPAPWPYLAL